MLGISLSCPDRNGTTFPWSFFPQPSCYTNYPSLALLKKVKQETTQNFGVNTSGIMFCSTPGMKYKNYVKNFMDLVCVGGYNCHGVVLTDDFGVSIRTYKFTVRALVSLVIYSVSKIVRQIDVGFTVCLVCVYKFCCSIC
jgi:hypothetical protein